MTESENPAVPETAAECKCCFVKISPADLFCQACGFPLKGTADEQSQFFYTRNYQHMEMDSLKGKIKSAGTTLYILAGVFLLYGLILFFFQGSNDNASALLITNAVVAIIFLLLGYWSEKKPLAAIISGMTLYILVQLLAAIDDPLSILKGIIFKVIVISYLIKGLLSALEAEKIKKQYNL
jgi:hypothetical protein